AARRPTHAPRVRGSGSGARMRRLGGARARRPPGSPEGSAAHVSGPEPEHPHDAVGRTPRGGPGQLGRDGRRLGRRPGAGARRPGATIARGMAAYERGDPGVTAALRAMKQVAAGMAEALRAANLMRVALLLTENWTHQRSLVPEMCTPEMSRLEQAVTAAGALGGKAAGSGAGGCMFFVTGDHAEPV